MTTRPDDKTPEDFRAWALSEVAWALSEVRRLLERAARLENGELEEGVNEFRSRLTKSPTAKRIVRKLEAKVNWLATSELLRALVVLYCETEARKHGWTEIGDAELKCRRDVLKEAAAILADPRQPSELLPDPACVRGVSRAAIIYARVFHWRHPEECLPEAIGAGSQTSRGFRRSLHQRFFDGTVEYLGDRRSAECARLAAKLINEFTGDEVDPGKLLATAKKARQRARPTHQVA